MNTESHKNIVDLRELSPINIDEYSKANHLSVEETDIIKFVLEKDDCYYHSACEQIQSLIEVFKSNTGDNTLEKGINPIHYNNKEIQPIQFIVSNSLNFNEGNIVKYITRV